MEEEVVVEEEVVEEYVPETAEAGPEPTYATEIAQATDVPAAVPEGNAYDFKEYDLKEYDANELGGSHYDYGAYDDLGNAGPAPTAMAYDDEIGKGKPAETDVYEATVSMARCLFPHLNLGCKPSHPPHGPLTTPGSLRLFLDSIVAN